MGQKGAAKVELGCFVKNQRTGTESHQQLHKIRLVSARAEGADRRRRQGQ